MVLVDLADLLDVELVRVAGAIGRNCGVVKAEDEETVEGESEEGSLLAVTPGDVERAAKSGDGASRSSSYRRYVSECRNSPKAFGASVLSTPTNDKTKMLHSFSTISP